MNLAEKYRPTTLDEVIGNEAVTEVLKKQLETDTVSQTILFHGPPGTGKTTYAYLLGEALGAQVKEIDCGSNGSVDTIRNEVVGDSDYGSLFHEKKLFLLDEAHRLSTVSFSALLRTIETPKPNVHFVFATTELDKIPKNIRSRCVIYETKPATNKDLGDAVRRFMREEGVAFENLKDLWSVVELSEGSYRSAYSYLEKLLAVAEEEVTPTPDSFRISDAPAKLVTSVAISEILGSGKMAEVNVNLPKAFISGNRADIMKGIVEAKEEGRDANGTARGLYAYLSKAGGNPEMMYELAMAIASNTVTYYHLEAFGWKYGK